MIKFFDVNKNTFLNFTKEDIAKSYREYIKIKNKYYVHIYDKQDDIYYLFYSSSKQDDVANYKIDPENEYVIKISLNNEIYLNTYGVRKTISFYPKMELNIGDKCLCGCFTNCSIIGKDMRGYYYIKHYPSKYNIERNPECASNASYSVHHWMSVYPIIENPATIEFSRDMIKYSNQCIFGIINKIIHFGVDFNPEYQRGDVWTEEQKVKLIDSIYKNINIGAIVFVEKMWHNNKNQVTSDMFEVLDGKQRLTAIFEYMQSKFPYKGKYYYELSPLTRNLFEEQQVLIGELMLFKNNGQSFYNKNYVLEQFIRLNECGTTMKQETIEKAKDILGSAIKNGTDY